MVKNLPAVQETQVQSLGQEDLLKEEMAVFLFAWKIPWTVEPDITVTRHTTPLSPTDTTPRISFFFKHLGFLRYSFFGEFLTFIESLLYGNPNCHEKKGLCRFFPPNRYILLRLCSYRAVCPPQQHTSHCNKKKTLFYLLMCLFICLHQALVAACGIFSCSMQTPSCSRWDLVP